jgi:L-lactate dehydrogenase complex protein LldG
MSNPRDEFLDRVRRAVIEGNRAGGAPALPERGSTGYQGAGSDPLGRFVQECTAAGGRPHVVPSSGAATTLLVDLVRQAGARRVLLGQEAILAELKLEAELASAGVEVRRVQDVEAAAAPAAFFQPDLGITGVDHLIAETGSVVLRSRPEQPRSISLLPPVHIAVASRGQLLADLFDLFQSAPSGEQLPSGMTIITGPSKTGDIELRLVTGVHGPGVLHVVVIDADSSFLPKTL